LDEYPCDIRFGPERIDATKNYITRYPWQMNCLHRLGSSYSSRQPVFCWVFFQNSWTRNCTSGRPGQIFDIQEVWNALEDRSPPNPVLNLDIADYHSVQEEPSPNDWRSKELPKPSRITALPKADHFTLNQFCGAQEHARSTDCHLILRQDDMELTVLGSVSLGSI
jgi:hypothetical protein